jgi:hypothetical protein
MQARTALIAASAAKHNRSIPCVHTWFGDAGLLIAEATRAILIDNMVLPAVAEGQVCCGARRAAAAGCWVQPVGGVGHTVSVCGAVLSLPSALQGFKEQPLACLDVCEAMIISKAADVSAPHVGSCDGLYPWH